jgi:hypothetical protein
MEADDPNPFLQKHKEDAVKAWKMLEAEQALRAQEGAAAVDAAGTKPSGTS